MKERCKDCTLTLGTAFTRSKVKYVLYNESLTKSEKRFVFRSFFHLGDTEDVFKTVKVGRLRVEKVLWPWHEDVWVQALPVSLKLYLFHVRYFIFCDICDILYSCDICDILYSWPLAIRNVFFFAENHNLSNTVYLVIYHISYICYIVYFVYSRYFTFNFLAAQTTLFLRKS